MEGLFISECLVTSAGGTQGDVKVDGLFHLVLGVDVVDENQVPSHKFKTGAVRLAGSAVTACLYCALEGLEQTRGQIPQDVDDTVVGSLFPTGL